MKGPQFGHHKGVLPLRMACWVQNYFLSKNGPVLPPRYGILSTGHKIIHRRLAPETADLLQTMIRRYRITYTSCNKYE
jgi:hypothetical protein